MRAAWIVPLAAALLLLGAPSLASSQPIPFVRARAYRPGRQKAVRLVVLHSTEGGTPQTVGAMFAAPEARTSAHYVVSASSTIQCVDESDAAFAAPGANEDGVHVEICGWAQWSAAQWRDSGVLGPLARLLRDVCRRHGLPLVHVDVTGLRGAARGITTHAEVTEAFGASTHTDPGAGFPFSDLLSLARAS